jgi:hypothetical protein
MLEAVLHGSGLFQTQFFGLELSVMSTIDPFKVLTWASKEGT